MTVDRRLFAALALLALAALLGCAQNTETEPAPGTDVTTGNEPPEAVEPEAGDLPVTPEPEAAPETATTEPADTGDFTTTSSGLKYQITQEGTGESPQAGDQVTVHYTGTLDDGTKFDSSVDRGQPFTFTIGRGQVIEGWDEGVMDMKVGEKRTLVIPAELGYGEMGSPPVIPPGATLHFDVELLGVERGQ